MKLEELQSVDIFERFEREVVNPSIKSIRKEHLDEVSLADFKKHLATAKKSLVSVATKLKNNFDNVSIQGYVKIVQGVRNKVEQSAASDDAKGKLLRILGKLAKPTNLKLALVLVGTISALLGAGEVGAAGLEDIITSVDPSNPDSIEQVYDTIEQVTGVDLDQVSSAGGLVDIDNLDEFVKQFPPELHEEIIKVTKASWAMEELQEHAVLIESKTFISHTTYGTVEYQDNQSYSNVHMKISTPDGSVVLTEVETTVESNEWDGELEVVTTANGLDVDLSQIARSVAEKLPQEQSDTFYAGLSKHSMGAKVESVASSTFINFLAEKVNLPNKNKVVKGINKELGVILKTASKNTKVIESLKQGNKIRFNFSKKGLKFKNA